MFEELLKRAEEDLKSASSIDELLRIKGKYVGRRDGELSILIKKIKDLSPDERAGFGKGVNYAKRRLDELIEEKERDLRKRSGQIRKRLDLTLPGRVTLIGRLHPITSIIREIEDIFKTMGFSLEDGPEVELDYYNFSALNIPQDHPARYMHDTFYIRDDIILRTHTSPVQIRVMEKKKPPLRIIVPGKVYRCDSDISHTPMFHQVEGLMVDLDTSMSHLKGVIGIFLRELFGEKTLVRFRPSYFPFTEPSAEVDIRCELCDGNGCRTCSNTGWLEVMGCGMVHPQVFRNVGYDPERWTGFAFGLGVERLVMLKFGIDDIRLFFENEQRFLHQF